MPRVSSCLAVALATFIGGAQAFYLPGVAPREFVEGEKIEVKVTKLSSVRTHMPYEYYSMPFCKPDIAESFAENLGEVLQGDRILSSAYDLKMDLEESCKVLCQRDMSKADMEMLAEKVEDDYYINWLVRDLTPLPLTQTSYQSRAALSQWSHYSADLLAVTLTDSCVYLC
jgi:transmembrane 9 superfamily protein 2/4